ncbi:MAG TPA: phosphatase PAP2 family protein [Polyangiales bacterium]|nr:phosphatase PAP2 family protein [Polyangiales bacterium]
MRAAAISIQRLGCVLLCASALSASAQARDVDDVVHPWQHLGEGLTASLTWPAVTFHISAALVTVPLVYTADEPVQRWFQRPGSAHQVYGQTAFIVGGVTPVALPLGLYLGGLAAGGSELATAGAAALQAAAVQALFVTTLKWLTDRAGPYPDGDPARMRALSFFRDSEHADDFSVNPFDVSGGLRWPSGHTASNVAMVSALTAFYPDEYWLPAVGYPFALAIGIGMIDGDYHWLSDVVAGALIGHVVGWTIGRNFRRHYDAQRRGDPGPASGVEIGIGPGGTLGPRGWF